MNKDEAKDVEICRMRLKVRSKYDIIEVETMRENEKRPPKGDLFGTRCAIG